MTLVVLVITVAVLVLAAMWLMNRHAMRGGLDDVDRFAAARGVTSRWAADPASAPAPVRRMAEELAKTPGEPPSHDVSEV